MPPTSSLPELGPRGEGWVVLQFVLFALVVLAELAGGPRGSATWALVPGFAGIVLFAWSCWALGSALTPFPRPRPGVTRVDRGPYRFSPHPMYVAVLLLCAAACVRAPLALLPTAALAIVLACKARLETRWLDEQPRPPD